MRKTALQRLMTWIYSLIFRGHVESLCPFWSLIWDLIHIKSRFSSILVLILPPRVGTGDSSAQCSFLLFTMTKKDPISVTNGGENKKKSLSSEKLFRTQTVVDLLIPPAEAQPGRADRVRPDGSGDQWPAGRERSPAPRRYESTNRRSRRAGCSFTCYVRHVFRPRLSPRWRESHAVVKKLLRGLLSSYSRRAETTGEFVIIYSDKRTVSDVQVYF